MDLVPCSFAFTAHMPTVSTKLSAEQLTIINNSVSYFLTPQFRNSFGYLMGAGGSVVVKALCCKPEGRGFDTGLGEFLNLPNPSGRTGPRGLFSL
jgi:hypothetical protein